jgi:putative ABC transport system substrate-binding protein
MLTLRGIGIAVLVLLMAAVAADAQQPGRHARVGYLVGGAPAFDPRRHDHGALVTGLREQGYIVGQNVVIEFRSALGGGNDRWRELAGELVALKVDVIVTPTETGVTACRDASRTIPIVMAGASADPVASGLVASLARPGGSVTGVTLGDLAGKRVQLLKEALPGARI